MGLSSWVGGCAFSWRIIPTAFRIKVPLESWNYQLLPSLFLGGAMHLDEAICFLIDLAKGHHRPTDYGKYGYEIHLVEAIHIYWRDVEQAATPGGFNSQEAEKLAELFYDAAWELCRRGIFRPSVKHILDQGEEGGRGYSAVAQNQPCEEKGVSWEQ